MILVCIVFPYFICSEIDIFDNMTINYLGCIVDFFLILEIIINFFIQFKLEDEYVSTHKYIIMNYALSLNLLIDLTLAFPFYVAITYLYMIQDSSSSFFSRKYLTLNNDLYFYCFIGRWLRILHLIKFWNIVNYYIYDFFKFEEYQQITKNINLLKVGCFLLVLLHNFACIWIFIGEYESLFSDDNWILHFNISDDNNKLKIYVSSLYFKMVSVTTIGYGDIFPCTIIEKTYQCIFLFISTQLYNLIISWISSTISSSSNREEKHNNNIKMLKNLVSEYNVSENFERELRKSLIFIKNNTDNDKHSLIDELPTDLKNLLFKKIFESKLTKLQFFINSSEDFIYYVTPKIQLLSLKKGETLISIGDIFTELIMINKGSLSFLLGPKYENYNLLKVNKGYHFGDVNMFLNERSEFSIKASYNNSEVFTLKKSFYVDVKLNFLKKLSIGQLKTIQASNM